MHRKYLMCWGSLTNNTKSQHSCLHKQAYEYCLKRCTDAFEFSRRFRDCETNIVKQFFNLVDKRSYSTQNRSNGNRLSVKIILSFALCENQVRSYSVFSFQAFHLCNLQIDQHCLESFFICNRPSERLLTFTTSSLHASLVCPSTSSKAFKKLTIHYFTHCFCHAVIFFFAPTFYFSLCPAWQFLMYTFDISFAWHWPCIDSIPSCPKLFLKQDSFTQLPVQTQIYTLDHHLILCTR